jgi:hypothetical protein
MTKEDIKMKRLLITTVLALAFSLLVTGVALAADGEDTSVTTGEIALILAPLVAAATAIERFIEMIFDGYESLVLSTGDFLGQGRGYIRWAKQQVRELQEAVLQNSSSGDPGVLSQAEDALAAAQDRLADVLKSPLYTSRKRVISLVAGIVFGVIVAFTARLQMLAMIAGLFGGGSGTSASSTLVEAGRGIDMFLTGLIVGTGSAPVHSLIGLLQNTKDAVDKARALWAGNAVRAAAQADHLLAGAPAGVAPPEVRPTAAVALEADAEEIRPRPAGEVETRRRISRLLR